MVDGFQFYRKFSKLVLGERFRRNDWISYQLFAQKLPQFCLSLHNWNTFYFFERKKGKKLIRSSNKSMFLQGDVTQLTTILPRSK